ncbi:hypothetical protein HKD37_14G041236 [Glycine soja]
MQSHPAIPHFTILKISSTSNTKPSPNNLILIMQNHTALIRKTQGSELLVAVCKDISSNLKRQHKIHTKLTNR